MSLTTSEQAIYNANLKKLSELRADKQWAAYGWHQTCWTRGFKFRISEALRKQERQNMLILQGRFTQADFWEDVQAGKMSVDTARRGIALLHKHGGRAGPKVTYTLDSMHTKGLAVDVYPLGKTRYEDIEDVAREYNIDHPLTKGSFIDLPHFEFEHAIPEPVVNRAAALERLRSMIETAGNVIRKSRLMRRLRDALSLA